MARFTCFARELTGPGYPRRRPAQLSSVSHRRGRIRRSMVEEGVYLYCQPEYRDEKHSSVVMHLIEASRLRCVALSLLIWFEGGGRSHGCGGGGG
jgi:hypothetical protein